MREDVNKSIEETFGYYLRENSMRFTSERRNILKEVFYLHRHFDAEELFQIIYRKKMGISHASVYRTLSLLVKAELVSRSVSYGGSAMYEHVYGHEHHDHMVCVRCGRRIEFKDDNIEELQLQICKRYGFKPEYHQLEINGLCKNCVKLK